MSKIYPIITKFKSTSSLSDHEVKLARKILDRKQPFCIYFNAAIDNSKKGHDNCWFHINENRGLVMGIDFEDLRVISIIGEVDLDVLKSIGHNPHRTEFHVSKSYAYELKIIGGNRLVRMDELKYYILEREEFFMENFEGLRCLLKADLVLVEDFYTKHYEGTIFSPWMLEQPFVGMFKNGELVAAGGTIVIDWFGSAANIGNFLTAPKFRGHGFGKIVMKKLINELEKQGISTFTLGTTEENVSAWKCYESVGFSLLERRIEIEFTKKGS